MAALNVVANKDVPFVILEKKIRSAKNPEEKEIYEKQRFELMQGREMVIKSMQQIVTKCTNSPEDVQKILHGKSKAYATREYKEISEHYKEKCFNWHETKYQSAMEHLYLFANLLEEKVAVERIKNAIEEVGTAMKTEKEKEQKQEQEKDKEQKQEQEKDKEQKQEQEKEKEQKQEQGQEKEKEKEKEQKQEQGQEKEKEKEKEQKQEQGQEKEKGKEQEKVEEMKQ